MLDIKFIRDNRDLIAAGARKKHLDFNVDELLKVDDRRRAALASIEKKRAEQNRSNEKVASATGGERDSLISELASLKESLQKEEEGLKKIMQEWQFLMLHVPNIPDMSVPEGKSDADNAEVKRVGTPPRFSFKPKNHIEIAAALALADFERGAEVSGFRGYFLTGAGARLSFALWQFLLDFWRKKHPKFELMIAPSLVRKEALLGSGYLPQGKDDLYVTQDGEYLAGTGEVAAMAYFGGTVLPRETLPKKILAFSPCFRREAGSHGKDTKGLMRVHEFFKFEQVVLCEASHATSVAFHEELNRNMEEVIEALGIPYRTVVNCGGDLGLGQVKKYDIDLWVPTEGAYREISSASYFHDFQSRRLNIRYRDADGSLKFAHSLNSTALPTPRILIALLENNQKADGTVAVPEALRPYVGSAAIGTA